VDLLVEKGPQADRFVEDLEAGALLCAVWPPIEASAPERTRNYHRFRDRTRDGRETGVSSLGVDDRRRWERGAMHTLVYIENFLGSPLALVFRVCRLWAWTPGGPAAWNPRP